MSLFGPPNIDKLKSEGNIKGLIKALQYKKTVGIRQKAAYALGELAVQAAPAVDQLIICLSDESHYVRSAAAHALGHIGSPHARTAVPKLIELLDDTEGKSGSGFVIEGVTDTAARALGQIGDTRAVKPLAAKMIKDRVPLYQKEHAARDALVKISEAAVPALVEMLGHQDKSIQEHACAALSEIGAPAVPVLATVRSSSDVTQRRLATHALGLIGGTTVVPALIDMLSDEDMDICYGAAYWLAKIGTPEAIAAAVPILEKLLNQDEQSYRNQAAVVLKEINWTPQTDEDKLTYALASKSWDDCVSLGEAAVPALIDCLRSADTEIYNGAAAALGKIGAPHARTAVPALIQLLTEHNSDFVAEALGELRDARAVEVLITKLPELQRGSLHNAAAAALAKIGKPAIPALIEVLGSDHKYCMLVVADALRSVYALAVPALIEALNDERENVRSWTSSLLNEKGWKPETEAQTAAYAAARQNWDQCVKIGEPAIPALINCLEGNHYRVMTHIGKAADALVAIGEPAVEPLIACLGSGSAYSRRNAAYVLGQIGDTRAVPALIDYLNKDELGHAEAIRALANFKDERAVDPIIAVLKQDRININIAASALTQIGKPAVPALIACLDECEDSYVRGRVVGALGEIDDDRVVDLLINRLSDKDTIVRQKAAYYIGNFGSRAIAAVDPLITLLDDENEDVYVNAAQILKQLGTPKALEALKTFKRKPKPVATPDPVEKAMTRLETELLPGIPSLSIDHINEQQRSLAHSWQGAPMVSGSMAEILDIVRRRLEQAGSSQIQIEILIPDMCVLIATMAGTVQSGGRRYQSANACRIWRHEDTYYFYSSS